LKCSCIIYEGHAIKNQQYENDNQPVYSGFQNRIASTAEFQAADLEKRGLNDTCKSFGDIKVKTTLGTLAKI
jgi:hypothetical protein